MLACMAACEAFVIVDVSQLWAVAGGMGSCHNSVKAIGKHLGNVCDYVRVAMPMLEELLAACRIAMDDLDTRAMLEATAWTLQTSSAGWAIS